MVHPQGYRGPQVGPKTSSDTPKVAAFCFVRLTTIVCDPPIKISVCCTVFYYHPPHLSLEWAYCTPMAKGAPTEAPKQAEIPLEGFVLLCLPHNASM